MSNPDWRYRMEDVGRGYGEAYAGPWSGGGGAGPGYARYGYVVTTTFVGRGPRSYRRSDARIEEDVNEELTRHPDLDAGDIEVKVENGEVTHNRLTVKRGLGERVSEMLIGGGGEEEKGPGVQPRGRSTSRPRGRKGSSRSR